MSGKFLGKVTFFVQVEEKMEPASSNSILILPKPNSGKQGAPVAKVRNAFRISGVAPTMNSVMCSMMVISQAAERLTTNIESSPSTSQPAVATAATDNGPGRFQES